LHLDHVNLLALKAASGEAHAPNHHLYAVKGRTVATDGHVLVQVDAPVAQTDLFFPTVEGAIEDDKAVVIPHQVAATALKLIGKKPEKLDGLCMVGHDKEGQCVVANVGAENRPVIQCAGQPEGFPDVMKALPKGKPVFEITVDVELLKLVADVSKAHTGHHGLRLMFYGEDKPIVLRSAYSPGGSRVTGMVAPMREPDQNSDQKE
jgi:hypothetical protein